MEFRLSRILANGIRKHSGYYLLALTLLLILSSTAQAIYISPFIPGGGEGPTTPKEHWWNKEITDWYWADLLFGWDGNGRLTVWEALVSIGLIVLSFGAVAAVMRSGLLTARIASLLLKFPTLAKIMSPMTKLINVMKNGIPLLQKYPLLNSAFKVLLRAEPIRLYVSGRYLTYNAHRDIHPEYGAFDYYTKNVFNERLPWKTRALGIASWAADDLLIYSGMEYASGGTNLFKGEMLYRLGLGQGVKGVSPVAFEGRMFLQGTKQFWTTLRWGEIATKSIEFKAVPGSLIGLATPTGIGNAARVGHICGFFNLPITSIYSLMGRGRLPTLEEYMFGFSMNGSKMPGYRESWIMGTIFGGVIEGFSPVLKPAVQRIPLFKRATFVSPESFGSMNNYLRQYAFSERVISSIMEEMIREQIVDFPSNIRWVGGQLYSRGIGTDNWLIKGAANLDIPFWNETPFITTGIGELFQESFDPFGKTRTMGGQATLDGLSFLTNLIFGAPGSSNGPTTPELKEIMLNTKSNFETFKVRSILADYGVRISDPVKLDNIGKLFTAYGEMGYTPAQVMNSAIRQGKIDLSTIKAPAGYNSFSNALSSGVYDLSAQEYKYTSPANVLRPKSLNGLILQTDSLGALAITNPQLSVPYAGRPASLNGMIISADSLAVGSLNIPAADLPIINNLVSAKTATFPSINNMVNAGIPTSEIKAFYSGAGPSVYVSQADAASIKALTGAGFEMAQVGNLYREAAGIEITTAEIPAIKQLSSTMSFKDIGALLGGAGTSALTDARLPLVQEMHAAGYSGAEIGEFLNTAGINFHITRADYSNIRAMHQAGMSMQDIGRLYDLQSIGPATRIGVQGLQPGQNIHINSQNVGEIISLHKAGVSIKTIGVMLNTGATTAEISALSIGLGVVEVSIQDAPTIKVMMQNNISPQHAGEIYNALQTSAGPAIEFGKAEAALSASAISIMIDAGIKPKDAGSFLKSAGGDISLIMKSDSTLLQSAIQALGPESAGKLYSQDGIQFFHSNMQTVGKIQTDLSSMDIDFQTEGRDMIKIGGQNVIDAYRNNYDITKNLIKSVGPLNAANTINTFTQEDGGLNLEGVQSIIGLSSSNPEAVKSVLDRYGPKTVSENSETIGKLFSGLGDAAPKFINALTSTVLADLSETDIRIANNMVTQENPEAAAGLFSSVYANTGKTLAEAGLTADAPGLGALLDAVGPWNLAITLTAFQQKTGSMAEALDTASRVLGQLGIDGYSKLAQSRFFERDMDAIDLSRTSPDSLAAALSSKVAEVFYRNAAASFAATGVLEADNIEQVLRFLDQEHRAALLITLLRHEESRLTGHWRLEKDKHSADAKKSYTTALELSELVDGEVSCELIETLLRGDKAGFKKILIQEILPIIAETKGYVGEELERIKQTLEKLEIEFCGTWGAHYSPTKDKPYLYLGELRKGMSAAEYVAALFALLHESEHLPERITSQTKRGAYTETGTTEFGEGFSSIMPLKIAEAMYLKTGNKVYKAVALMYSPAIQQQERSRQLDDLRAAGITSAPLDVNNLMPSLAWIQEEYGLGETDSGHVAPQGMLEKVLPYYGYSTIALNNDLRFKVGEGEEYPDLSVKEAIGMLNNLDSTKKPEDMLHDFNVAFYNLMRKSVYNGDADERRLAEATVEGFLSEIEGSEQGDEFTHVFDGIMQKIEHDYPGSGKKVRLI